MTKPKVILFLNNLLGLQILGWLQGQNDCEIVAVIMHPEETQKYGGRIIDAIRTSVQYQAKAYPVLRWGPETIARLPAADIGLSICFGYKLQRGTLNWFTYGCFNLHTGFLPFNRGAHPNVWAIVDETPAGVTLHWMDEGIDTGDVAANVRVPVSIEDTGETLYRKLEDHAYYLFTAEWWKIRDRQALRIPQSQISPHGTRHTVKDLESLDDLSRFTDPKHLFDVLRARTFTGYKGCFIRDENGEKVYVSVVLSR